MKIALITDDGESISMHFGRARYYLVVTIEDGKVVSREMRDKLGHAHFAGQEETGHESHENNGQGHGFGEASHNRHTGMAQVIADCETLVCGGMGAGAYASMRQLNIRPVVTNMRRIDDVLHAYLSGTLQDHTELLH